MGDIIVASGIVSRSNSIPVCLGHDTTKVIGRAVWRYDAALDGIRATITFADTPLGKETYALVKAGVLTDVSVGIDALERTPIKGGMKYTKSRLMEISVVAVGAHPAAIVTHKSLGLATGGVLSRAQRQARAKALGLPGTSSAPSNHPAMQYAEQAARHATAVQNIQAGDTRRQETRQAIAAKLRGA